MREWLQQLDLGWAGRGREISPGEFLLLLAASALAALVVATLYRSFYGRASTGSDVHRAFPLLGIAITAIFVCIQFSLPLSLGLLGALSIVRFRTPIKEPEEIGFLMVVIATSLACATGRLLFLALTLVAAVGGLLLQQLVQPVFRRRRDRGLIIATYADAVYTAERAKLLASFASLTRRGQIDSLTAQEGRVTVTWRFAGLPPGGAVEVERALREQAAPESLAILFGGNDTVT